MLGNLAPKWILFIMLHFAAFEHRLVEWIRELDISRLMKTTSQRQIKFAVFKTIFINNYAVELNIVSQIIF
jgi:hypothetical protein